LKNNTDRAFGSFQKLPDPTNDPLLIWRWG